MAIKKKRKRAASTFVSDCVNSLNAEIRAAYVKVTGEDKIWSVYDRITKTDVEEIYQKYRGRCVYCDKALRYLGTRSHHSARVTWYIPLNVGGEARPDNLIVSCQECVKSYRSTRKLREDMIGLDSFADTVEALFIAVRDHKDQTVIDQLKCRLNVRLSDVANCMRYITKSDWIAHSSEIIEENANTLADRIEALANGEDTRDKITNTMKQIVTTKKYKIIRSRDADS